MDRVPCQETDGRKESHHGLWPSLLPSSCYNPASAKAPTVSSSHLQAREGPSHLEGPSRTRCFCSPHVQNLRLPTGGTPICSVPLCHHLCQPSPLALFPLLRWVDPAVGFYTYYGGHRMDNGLATCAPQLPPTNTHTCPLLICFCSHSSS